MPAHHHASDIGSACGAPPPTAMSHTAAPHASASESAEISRAQPARAPAWTVTNPAGCFNQQLLLFPQEAAILLQAEVVEELRTGGASSRRLDWIPSVGVATRQEMLLAAVPSGKRRDNIEKLLKRGPIQPNSANQSTSKCEAEDRPGSCESGSLDAEMVTRPPPAMKTKTHPQPRFGDGKKRAGSQGLETTSGAKPPAQKPKTTKTTELNDGKRDDDENTADNLPSKDLCALRECEAWLDSPQAASLLKGAVGDAKTTVQALLVYPPRRVSLEAIYKYLNVKRERKGILAWPARCVGELVVQVAW
mgnify:CR=1 FL=1